VRIQHLGAEDAHLEALEIVRLLQRLVRAHLLEAVVPERQALDALGVELVEQLLADRALRDEVGLLEAVEQVGQVEGLEIAQPHRAELAQRRREHLHRAELQRLELLLVLVERAGRVDLDLHAALGVLLGVLLEVLEGLVLRRVRRVHVADLDHDRRHGRLRRGQAAEHQRRGAENALNRMHGGLSPK
jgi:hypothetical protein